MPNRRDPPAGFSLVELLTVLVITAILLAIAVPALEGVLDGSRSRGALERLAGSIYLARMHAIRTGGQVRITFEWDPDRECVRGYVVEEVEPRRVLTRVDVARDLPAGCLGMSNADRPLVFDARGMPRGVMARTLVARSGTRADTLVMSQLGRVLRVY